MSTPSTNGIAQAATSARAILDLIEAGELEATPLEHAHLAGSLTVLDRAIYVKRSFPVN